MQLPELHVQLEIILAQHGTRSHIFSKKAAKRTIMIIILLSKIIIEASFHAQNKTLHNEEIIAST